MSDQNWSPLASAHNAWRVQDQTAHTAEAAGSPTAAVHDPSALEHKQPASVQQRLRSCSSHLACSNMSMSEVCRSMPRQKPESDTLVETSARHHHNLTFDAGKDSPRKVAASCCSKSGQHLAANPWQSAPSPVWAVHERLLALVKRRQQSLSNFRQRHQVLWRIQQAGRGLPLLMALTNFIITAGACVRACCYSSPKLHNVRRMNCNIHTESHG